MITIGTALTLITGAAAITAIIMGGLVKIFSAKIKPTCEAAMDRMDQEIKSAADAAAKANKPITRLETKLEFFQQQLDEMKGQIQNMNQTILLIYKDMPKRKDNGDDQEHPRH